MNTSSTLAIDLPSGWERAADRALAIDDVIMILGGPDRGKSTFCRYLLGRARAESRPAAFIDGDLGQSHLGPPATLGLNFYPPRPPDDSGLFPDVLYFIGQTSPPGRMMELVVGLRHLADIARRRGQYRIIVNTSGFIGGPAAHRLKLAKAESLAPRLVIGLQQEQELASILAPLQRFRPEAVLTLPVSAQAQPKPFQQRRLYRQERFAAYFQTARLRHFPLEHLAWLGFPFGQGRLLPAASQQWLGQILNHTPVLRAEEVAQGFIVLVDRRLTESDLAATEAELGQKKIYWAQWRQLEYRLVGLLDRHLLTLALGLLPPSPWNHQFLGIVTPLPADRLSQVKFCRLGKMRLSPDGQELFEANTRFAPTDGPVGA